jgi:uncharacterized protein YciI
VKYVLLYDSAPDVAANAPAHYAGHAARVGEFQAAGTLLMVGVFADVQADGAMAIFTTAEAAEDFAQGDPFVRNGVVRSWRVLPWNEVLT